jgi:hypothetical protein
VTLVVTAGAVTDADGATDITAGTATVTLSDAAAQNFGAVGNPIQTSVSSLNVDTSAGGGSQWITESNGLTQLNLNAGAGNVTLVVTLGAVSDADGAVDIAAGTATVTLSDVVARDFGSAVNPIQTSVDSLNVSTSAGGGNEFITESNGLTQLNLNAGTGNVTLVVTLGAVTDTDGAMDIRASDLVSRPRLASALRPIRWIR